MTKWHEEGGLILVHCSAGVGRTGAFITLDIALEQADKVNRVDVAGIINRLRKQRKLMVQTEVGKSLLCNNNNVLHIYRTNIFSYTWLR